MSWGFGFPSNLYCLASAIFQSHHFSLHCFADTQIYFSSSAGSGKTVSCLNCVLKVLWVPFFHATNHLLGEVQQRTNVPYYPTQNLQWLEKCYWVLSCYYSLTIHQKYCQNYGRHSNLTQAHRRIQTKGIMSAPGHSAPAVRHLEWRCPCVYY